jgi:hypothetical protein
MTSPVDDPRLRKELAEISAREDPTLWEFLRPDLMGLAEPPRRVQRQDQYQGEYQGQQQQQQQQQRQQMSETEVWELGKRRAVDVYRKLGKAEPDTYRPLLAAALSSLGRLLHRMDEGRAATAATTESADIYRQIAAQDLAAHGPGLASALDDLGSFHRQERRRDDALASATAAVEVHTQLAAADPAKHEAGLAWALNNLSVLLSSTPRTGEALATAAKSVELYRRHASGDADLTRQLITALVNYAGIAALIGQDDDAHAAISEADERRAAISVD